MTRRDIFRLPALPLLSRAASSAAETQDVFPGVRYRHYDRCLPDFLRQLARRAYLARNQELAKLTDPTLVRQRQAWDRRTFRRLIGGLPESAPLNARTVGSFERPGYRVEKLVYESRPNFFIPANLYIPTTGRPPFPGVLFQMGHTANGKAGATYQRCCQGLARLGFLVLAFDPMGQGERIYYSSSSPDGEHTRAGKQMLLVGDTATRMQVWDAMRSLDYLASHPFADPRRLASTGQSGGGMMTMLLLALDDRLATAVVCSGNSENFACAGFQPPGSTDDAEQDFVDSGPAGFDRWDVFYPFAPKPLLISVSDHDFFGTYSPQYIASGWEEFQKLHKVYTVLGHPQNLAWSDTPLPHGLSYDTRMVTYNWLRRHLMGEPTPLREEPPVEVEPDRNLWVSESGSMVKSFHSETPFTLLRSRTIQRTPMPLQTLLRADRPAPGLRATVLRRAPSRGADIVAVEIPSAPAVWLPAWLYLPKDASPSNIALLALEPAGHNVRWQEGQLYLELARQGHLVLVPDLRGTGDMQPETSPVAGVQARRYNSEDSYAWSSLILGKPLVGQRVTDILAAAAAFRAYPAAAGRRLILAAAGPLTVPALFAGALDPHIDELYLSGGLAAYQSIVESETYTAPLVNFVPSLLLHTDLPPVAASMAPRRIRLAGAQDANGKTMEMEKLRDLYAAAPNVVLLPPAPWDAAGLLGA